LDPKDRLARVFSSEERIIILSPWVTLTPEDLIRSLGLRLRPDEAFRAKEMVLILDRKVTEKALEGKGKDFEEILVKWAAKGFDVVDVSEEGREGPGTHAKVYIGDDIILIGSLNMTKQGIDRLLKNDGELLVKPDEEDEENVRNYVEALQGIGRTLAVTNRNLDRRRWRTFLVKRHGDTIFMVPLKIENASDSQKVVRKDPIPVKEEGQEAGGFVFDGRLYRIESNNDWNNLDIEDYTSNFKNASEDEVENILKYFPGLRVHRFDPNNLELKITSKEDIEFKENARNYFEDNIKIHIGDIEEIKRLWGIHPLINWRSYRVRYGRKIYKFPYMIQSSGCEEILYINFTVHDRDSADHSNRRIGFIKYVDDIRKIEKIIKEQIEPKYGNYSFDLGTVKTTEGIIIPLIATDKKVDKKVSKTSEGKPR